MATQKSNIIYLITNTQNGKQYIGKTSRGLEWRWQYHCRDARRGSPTHLHNAIRKYGPDAFVYQLHEDLGTDATDADLNAREIYWIATLCTYSNGYNMTEGGEGMRGLVRSEETRAKLSAALKGRIVSAETRAKLSAVHKGKQVGEKNPMFGKTPSAETRAKMSAAAKMKVFSAEHRAKLSAAAKGKQVGEKNPMFGKTPSAETRAKMSAALKGEKNPNFGKTLSAETRAKLSAAHQGKKFKMSPESIAKREATKRRKREEQRATSYADDSVDI